MPHRKYACKNALAAAVGGRDDISNLPDGVLEHMLSFLPAHDAVRTCVLAKRWRHLWKSTPGLRFVCGGGRDDEASSTMHFVGQLLRRRIRGGTPLDACEFRLDSTEFLDSTDDGDDINRDFDRWIRIALQCKVHVLQFIYVGDCSLRLDIHSFISQYLKKLELSRVSIEAPSTSLDFSSCPVLEDLEFLDCFLDSDLTILSQSLKRLRITLCNFPPSVGRMPICARNLVSLWLEVCWGRAPWLQRMPSLLAAVVKIHGDDRVPLDSDNDNNKSILLQGLSEVQNLVLMSPDTEMFIFRRDLKFCSSFNKLKSLLLDEYWCEPADFSALACLLKLSPVLEKLTLQLYSVGPDHKVEIKLSCKPMDISTEISQHLKTLEVNCEVYDQRVRNVLTFLSKKLHIWFQFSG